MALRIAEPGDKVCTSSWLVVNQLLGKREVGKNMEPLIKDVWDILEKKKVRVLQIAAGENLAGLHLKGLFR